MKQSDNEQVNLGFAKYGIELITDTVLHTVDFFGVMVTSPVVLNAASVLNDVTGNGHSGFPLSNGFHSFNGSALQIDSGVCYLLKEIN